mgnify:CR=1|jgi:hypothetical protein
MRIAAQTHQLDLVEYRIQFRLSKPFNLRLDERHICQYTRQGVFVEPLDFLPAQRLLLVRRGQPDRTEDSPSATD